MKSTIWIKEREQNSCALLKIKQNKKTELLKDILAKELMNIHTALKALQWVWFLPWRWKEDVGGKQECYVI